ncbi:Bcr/CflA family efflux MFS transporter [Planomicrobium sp. CPCC 101079]|uniref:Bcr/CflA family efflux MFS transporter n=1 Tax=Planomicrobium sp. CPCC 101079 TaxID=2599618 RepID=UPI0011B578DE|nr:Bcr/CflA family efflux MFS transporter [Planomicrobium sp. CPCC 101079]TWT09281.1 Bcr/CflA family efflux MFS transporter [Planomicrobium sp. CPCC 101079]
MIYNPTGKARFGLALLLSLLGILAPLNIDMYLPSFPGIAADLNASASLVQLSLTTCLMGLAVGQLIAGPISDAQGRRKPILIAVSLFALSSIFCALATNITMLIVARFLQGFTASAGIVLSRAVVRDVFSGRELTKFFSLLMVINSVAPMAAPLAGGVILALPFANWQTIFYFLGFLGIVIVLTVGAKLPETLPPDKRSPSSIGQSLRTMGNLLKDRSYIGYTLIVGVVHGGSFAYVSGTPFVYQGIYGVSPQMFSVLFGINGLAIIFGSYLIGRFAGIVPEKRLLQIAVTTAGIATSVLLVATIIEGHLATIVIPIFIYMITIGMTLTSSFTLALREQGHRAGSASAVIGMLPMLIGAAVSPLVGIDETTAVPMGAILFITSLIGLITFYTLTDKKAQPIQSAARN